MVFHLQVAVAGGAGVVDLIWSDFKVVVRIKVADHGPHDARIGLNETPHMISCGFVSN